MKKLYLILCLILVTSLSVVCFIYLKNSNQKFYLDDKYYNEGKYVDITKEELENLINNKNTFILYSYNNFCSLKVPCEDIFSKVMNKYNIDILKIKFNDFKETSMYNKIKYAPSIILVENGVIINYLDSNKDEDLNKYEDATEFEAWLNDFIFLKK